MPVSQLPEVRFVKDFLPACPRLSHVQSTSKSEFNKEYLSRYRELNMLHSMLYTSYDCTISYLQERHDASIQRIACIMSRVMEPSGIAQQAIASFSSCRLVESAKEVADRKVGYTGPIVIVNEAAVRNKGFPSFVWTTAAYDSVEVESRFRMYGNDVDKHEEALIEDHIRRYRQAFAAQRALIPHLVDFLSLNKTLDRLTKCLTKLKVPKRTINAIAAKVSQLDCLWKDSIPADWLSTPPTPLPKPNKDCIIEEDSSSRYLGVQDDADCYITIHALPSSSQKQQEQQSCAIVSYSATHPADSTRTAPPSASQRPSKRGWGVRILKSIAAASVAVAGLVAGRNDPAVAAGFKAWLTQGQQ